MRRELTRRDVLKFSAIAAAGATSHFASREGGAIDYTKPVPEAKDLTAYLNNARGLIRWNNMPLTAYRANPALKYPYFYPLNGPVSGISLTAESALPYPHHRGLWLGCDPLNGGDYWSDGSLDRGQIRSVDLKLGETTPNSAVVTDRCQWVRKDAPSPLADERTFTISVPGDRHWLIDAEFKLTAKQDISIRKAKHSFFAIRTAADIRRPAAGS